MTEEGFVSSLYCIVVCLSDHTLISLSIVTDIVISLLITSSKWCKLSQVWRTSNGSDDVNLLFCSG